MELGDFNAWDGSYPEPGWGEPTVDIDLDTEQTGFYAATRLHMSDRLMHQAAPLRRLQPGRMRQIRPNFDDGRPKPEYACMPPVFSD